MRLWRFGGSFPETDYFTWAWTERAFGANWDLFSIGTLD